jgi:hypothetical protein
VEVIVLIRERRSASSVNAAHRPKGHNAETTVAVYIFASWIGCAIKWEHSTYGGVMRPGQLDVNDLERAILERLARDRPSLLPLIPRLHVLSREYTGVGSYTNFRYPERLPHVGNDRIGLHGHIEMPSVPNGLGAVLFLKNDLPHCLEIYTYGSELWDGAHSGFSIVEPTYPTIGTHGQE